MTIKTRFAPSPTGDLHIGGVRTALFSWLYARHHQGQFVLRIEDTDRERSTEEAVQVILDGMKWLGLDHDEGPFFQTQRFERYKEVIQQLLDEGKAYYCYCTKEEVDAMREEAMAKGEKPRYNGYWRDREDTPPEGIEPVVRFKNPLEGDVEFEDMIQGQVSYQNSELDDLIIARSDGTPTYNLTVVVDDLDMEISHVIRGDDHLNNTPRQINLIQALGKQVPVYAHVPLILSPEGKKLSKSDGAASVLEYRDEGILPAALLNYLVRLGWSHGDQEYFSQAEMIKLFSIEGVNKSAASINPEKLTWLNQQHLKNIDNAELIAMVKPMFEETGIDLNMGPGFEELVQIQKERVSNLNELVAQSLCYYQDFDDYDTNAAKKHLRPVVLEPFESLQKRLQDLENWQTQELGEEFEAVLNEYELKMPKLGQPLRVALTGAGMSPSIDVTLQLIGKDKTLNRMEKAIDFMRKRAAA